MFFFFYFYLILSNLINTIEKEESSEDEGRIKMVTKLALPQPETQTKGSERQKFSFVPLVTKINEEKEKLSGLTRKPHKLKVRLYKYAFISFTITVCFYFLLIGKYNFTPKKRNGKKAKVSGNDQHERVKLSTFLSF